MNHFASPNKSFALEEVLAIVRRESHPFSNNLDDIKRELRYRRQGLIGSHISLLKMTGKDGTTNTALIDELSHYLAARTIPFLSNDTLEDEEFCFRFYRLGIGGLVHSQLGHECLDDIIQLAECLVRSRQVFSILGKEILPPDMIGELFDFIDSYDESRYSMCFDNAVLGAICVFLGVLEDPLATKKNTNETENSHE